MVTLLYVALNFSINKDFVYTDTNPRSDCMFLRFLSEFHKGRQMAVRFYAKLVLCVVACMDILRSYS